MPKPFVASKRKVRRRKVATDRSTGLKVQTIAETAAASLNQIRSPSGDGIPYRLREESHQSSRNPTIVKAIILSCILVFSLRQGYAWRGDDSLALVQDMITSVTELAEEFDSSSWRDDIDSCKNSLSKVENFVRELNLPVSAIIQQAEELAENEKFVQAIFLHYAAIQTIFKDVDILDTIIGNSSSPVKKLMFDSLFLGKEAISKILSYTYNDHPHKLCSQTLWKEFIWTILHHHVHGKYYQHSMVKQSWRNISFVISHEHFEEWRVAGELSVETTTALQTLGPKSFFMETHFWSFFISHTMLHELLVDSSQPEPFPLNYKDVLDINTLIGLQEVMFKLFPYHI